MECATLSVHPPVSLLSILLCIYLLSDWRRLSPQHFLSQIDLLVSIEQLALHHRSRSALSRLRCNKHILPLTAYLSRIGSNEILCAATGITRLRPLLISFFEIVLWSFTPHFLQQLTVNTTFITSRVKLLGSLIFLFSFITNKNRFF